MNRLAGMFIRAKLVACLAAAAMISSASAAPPLYWDVDGTTAGFSTVVGPWNTGLFWNTDASGGAGGTTTATTTDADDLIIPQAAINTGSITVSGTQNASSITFAPNVGPTATITGGGPITIGGSGGSSGIFQQSSGANTISTAITLKSDITAFDFSNSSSGLLTIGAVAGAAASGTQTATVGSSDSGNITLSGIIGNGAAGGNVALDINSIGSGGTTLSGANTFTGGLTLTAGTLRATTSASALGAGTLTLNGGTLELVSDANPINWARPTTVGGDVTILVNRATVGGSGPVHTLNNTVGIGAHTVTFQGGDKWTGGEAQLQLGTTTLAGNATFNIENPVNGGVTNVVMRGAGMGDGGGGHSLAVEGSGALRIMYVSGSSTWTGGTIINGGEIHYRSVNYMPPSGNTAVNDGGTINVRVGGSGSWAFGTARGQVGGLLAGIGPTSSTVSWHGNVTLAVEGGGTTSQLFYDPTANGSSCSLELELRSGTLYLSGNNSYSGGTTVTSGEVRSACSTPVRLAQLPVRSPFSPAARSTCTTTT